MSHPVGKFSAAMLALLMLAASTALSALGREQDLHRSCSEVPEPGRIPYRQLAPRYSVERQEHDASKPPGLDLQIAVPTESVNEAEMVGLACKLASDFSQEHLVHALIFDDKESARRLLLYFTDQPHHGKYLWHLRALCEIDRKNRKVLIDYLLPEVAGDLLSLRRIRVWISYDPGD